MFLSNRKSRTFEGKLSIALRQAKSAHFATIEIHKMTLILPIG